MWGSDTPATQTTKTNTQPWKPAQPLLKDVISQYEGLDQSVTPGQEAALGNLTEAAGGLPNYGDAGNAALSEMFGYDVQPQVDMMLSGYGDLQSNLGGWASGEYLDPYSTPGFADALARLTQETTDKVKGVYAGSGRDPSGAGSFAGSLGRGILDATAPILMGQYNQNRNAMFDAAKALYGASGETAKGVTGLEQVPMANAAQAIGLSPAVSNAYMTPAQQQVAAANAAYAQPYQNLAMLTNPAAQVAGLGGTQSGTQTAQQASNPVANALGGVSGSVGILSALFSDERLKEGIEEVGALHDGQPVVRFRYAGDPVTRIGLLAQDVVGVEPDAVYDMGGMLAVDYGRATDRAAELARRV